MPCRLGWLNVCGRPRFHCGRRYFRIYKCLSNIEGPFLGFFTVFCKQLHQSDTRRNVNMFIDGKTKYAANN